VARQGHAEGLDNGDVPAQKRPFSPRYDGIPRTDPRCRDSRETALSIRILFERAAAGGNGAGKLVIDFLLEEQSWYSFTETERYHMEKLIRKFRRELVRTGFIDEAGSLPDEKKVVPGGRGGMKSLVLGHPRRTMGTRRLSEDDNIRRGRGRLAGWDSRHRIRAAQTPPCAHDDQRGHSAAGRFPLTPVMYKYTLSGERG
jgi:hypothetical protein